jgi:hypothetical protein
MTTSNAWNVIKARLVSTQWLIITAIILTSHGWINYEKTVVWEMSFYLKTLTLPLALALIVGAFPAVAPFNPDDSQDFWKVASVNFKLFLIVLVIVLVLFKLNSL